MKRSSSPTAASASSHLHILETRKRALTCSLCACSVGRNPTTAGVGGRQEIFHFIKVAKAKLAASKTLCMHPPLPGYHFASNSMLSLNCLHIEFWRLDSFPSHRVWSSIGNGLGLVICELQNMFCDSTFVTHDNLRCISASSFSGICGIWKDLIKQHAREKAQRPS